MLVFIGKGCHAALFFVTSEQGSLGSNEETMGDANKTSSGTTKSVESGQHSMQPSLPMNQNPTVAVSHNEKSSKFTGQNSKT
ncbi:hypothetical protein V6N11_049892 [Hibiscus sabdariffa]|uniref:Uncharacterized protein n=1 Tax=Hibiscus sabdariffa TaxID=183260 RepID=A0ABR2T8K3_9ROSI